LGASERDEFLRAAWRVLVCGGLDGRRFVFVDECSTNTSLSSIYGWSRRGQRVCFEAPRNWGANITLLSSMTLEGMGPSLAVEGATTKAVFEAYVERVLAPSLRPGRVVVMDNLGAHRGERVRELIEARGCSLLFLPPYSPDFSPIEEAFSKLKALLRKAKARTRVALVEAIGRALEAISTKDARGWFGHCGYLLSAQPL
jgi:transposase